MAYNSLIKHIYYLKRYFYSRHTNIQKVPYRIRGAAFASRKTRITEKSNCQCIFQTLSQTCFHHMFKDNLNNQPFLYSSSKGLLSKLISISTNSGKCYCASNTTQYIGLPLFTVSTSKAVFL